MRRIDRVVPLVCLISACSHHDSNAHAVPIIRGVPLAPSVTCASDDCRTYNVHPYVLAHSRYGITCLGNVPPGTYPDPDRRPQSYDVRDIGKPGFPPLTSVERSRVGAIRKRVRSSTLRIAWLADTEFVVFDATRGPCEPAPYAILTEDGVSESEFYEPGENPYHTMPIPRA